MVKFLTRRSEATRKYMNVQPVMPKQKSSGYTASLKKASNRGE